MRISSLMLIFIMRFLEKIMYGIVKIREEKKL